LPAFFYWIAAEGCGYRNYSTGQPNQTITFFTFFKGRMSISMAFLCANVRHGLVASTNPVPNQAKEQMQPNPLSIEGARSIHPSSLKVGRHLSHYFPPGYLRTPTSVKFQYTSYSGQAMATCSSVICLQLATDIRGMVRSTEISPCQGLMLGDGTLTGQAAILRADLFNAESFDPFGKVYRP
jgi:hypothetical protein